MTMKNEVSMNWSRISIVSILAFIGGWMIFGLFGAVIVSVAVLALMGILKVR